MTSTPTKISSASQILAMNNVAITRILDDEPAECLEIFRYALHQLQSSLQELVSNEAAVAAAATATQPRTPPRGHNQFQSVPLDTCNSKNTCTAATFSAAQSNNGTFSFFHRMMTLSSETLSTTTDNNSHLDISLLQFQNPLLVMLFFNMAVCHHHLGFRQGKSNELHTALQLYELAFGMVEGSPLPLADQQMLLLALYNNMGHVHSHFSNTAATQACVDWIQRIFLAFPPPLEQPQQPSTEQSATPKLGFDYEFFVQYMPLRPSEQGNIASAA